MEYLTETILFNNPSMPAARAHYHAKQLRKLFAAAHDKDTPLNTSWFKNDLAVWNQLSEVNDPKAFLPSLVKMFPRNTHFRNAMRIDGKERKKTFEDIECVYQDLSEDIAPILDYNGFIGQRDYIRLQDYAIVSLLCGIWIPIYRIMDVSSLKIRNFDRINDNFYDGNVVAFQKPTYQEIVAPPELRRALDALIRQTPNDYLFMTGEDRLPIQRFSYVIRSRFGVGLTELFKIRLDCFPFCDNIPDFCEDESEIR